MSNNIDFPEYLNLSFTSPRRVWDQDTSINSHRHNSYPYRRQNSYGSGRVRRGTRNRTNSVPASSIYDVEGQIIQSAEGQSETSGKISVESDGGRHDLEVGMGTRRNSSGFRTTLANFVAPLHKKDAYLINHEQVNPVDEDFGRPEGIPHAPTAVPPSNSTDSLQSIESLASFASSASASSLDSQEDIVTKSYHSKKSLKEGQSVDECTQYKGWRRYLGLILTLLSGLLYSLAAIIAKLLKEEGYHPFMISIWRFQGVFAPSILLVLYRQCYLGEKDFSAVWPLNKDRRKLKAFIILQLRGLFGCWSVILQFYSLTYMQVADSMVITSSTSVFVTLLAHCFIGEKCAVIPILTAMLTIAGVFVISRPPMLTGKEAFDQDILIGVSMALGCMILAAAILVIQRYLRNAHFSLISLSSGIWGTFQCVLLTFLVGAFKLPTGMKDTMLGLALAGITFFAQSFIVIALKFEQAGPVAVVQSTDVIFAFFWQFLFLGVVPDWFSLVGAVIIIGGVLLTAFRKCLISLPEDSKSRRRFRCLLL